MQTGTVMCLACGRAYRHRVRFCPRCGAETQSADSTSQPQPLVRLGPTPLEHQIVPFEVSRASCIREVGEVIKTRDVIAVQSGVACQWLAGRPDTKGFRMTQEVIVGGRFRRRTTLRASITVEMW